jgi:hypothetical protein
MKKKRTSRRVNNKNHHDEMKTPPEYQLVGSIEDSEEQMENATIEKDNDYWTGETTGGPAQYDEEIYKALYSTDKEAEETFSNDDGFFTDDEEDVEEMFVTDDGFLTDDSYLNKNGTTQSANHQGQEIKPKITYREVEEMFSNDDGFFTDDLDDKEMFATDDVFLTDDSYLNMNGTTQSANHQGQEILEEMFSNDDGFFTDDSFSTGNLQSTKRHEPVILLKNKVTEAPLLCRPNMNIHPSRKNLKPRPQPESPQTKKQKRQKNKARLKYTNWKTNERHNLPNWTSQHLAAYLSIPEMALEWIVEPG